MLLSAEFQTEPLVTVCHTWRNTSQLVEYLFWAGLIANDIRWPGVLFEIQPREAILQNLRILSFQLNFKRNYRLRITLTTFPFLTFLEFSVFPKKKLKLNIFYSSLVHHHSQYWAPRISADFCDVENLANLLIVFSNLFGFSIGSWT